MFGSRIIGISIARHLTNKASKNVYECVPSYMMHRTLRLSGILLALFSHDPAFSQQTLPTAFNASAPSCESVTWSKHALQDFPTINAACREVLRRNASYLVKLDCEVRRVAMGGRQLTVLCDGGVEMALLPPEALRFRVGDRMVAAAQVVPSNRLEFFIPQGELVARTSPDGPAELDRIPIAPPPRPRTADPQFIDLPRTASYLPSIGIAGITLILISSLLRARRSRRRNGG